MGASLAAFLTRRRIPVLAATGLLVVLAGLLALGLQPRLTSGLTDYDDPAADNVAARALIERETGINPQQGYVLLVRTDERIDPAAPRPAVVQAVVDLLDRRPEVREIVDVGATRNPAFVSSDGRSTVVIGRLGAVVEKDVIPQLERDVAAVPELAGRVEIGGPTAGNVQISQVSLEDLALAELIVFPLLFLLLVVVFRGVVAALLPLVGGMVTVLLTMLVLRGIVETSEMSIFALNLVFALGIGLSIDFSLLVVSRYREEAERSGYGVAALRTTLNTAGRTVLFSALTVASSLVALLVFPQRFLNSMGIAGILVTVAAAVFAVVVLPSVLAVLGRRVDALAPKRWQRRDADRTGARWRRLAELVMRRPALWAMAAAAVLVVLALPVTGVKFTGVDATVLPTSVSAGRVAEALEEDFATPLAGPLQSVVTAPAGAATDVADYARRIGDVDGVSRVVPPKPLGDGHWLVESYLDEKPLADRSRAAVERIQELPSPHVVRHTGTTADVLALNSSLRDHLPLALLLIVVSTLLVLFAMSGSVIIPIKAVLMNAMSLGAAYGVLVLIFQDGLLGFDAEGALESTSPVILFALAFGLSTDYGVFLVGRIKEARDSGLPDGEAVAAGLQHTGRIVTSAAALFCLAMSAMVLSRLTFLKELGLGTAFAVLLDATIVRALLVPSLMMLLGSRNWWAPAPLRWLHERLRLGRLDAPLATRV